MTDKKWRWKRARALRKKYPFINWAQSHKLVRAGFDFSLGVHSPTKIVQIFPTYAYIGEEENYGEWMYYFSSAQENKTLIIYDDGEYILLDGYTTNIFNIDLKTLSVYR